MPINKITYINLVNIFGKFHWAPIENNYYFSNSAIVRCFKLLLSTLFELQHKYSYDEESFIYEYLKLLISLLLKDTHKNIYYIAIYYFF